MSDASHVRLIPERLREFRKEADFGYTCYDCSLSDEFSELLEDAEEMHTMLLEWQKWWNETGFQWYVENAYPQSGRPPFLQSSSEHFQKWIGPKQEPYSN